MSEPMSGAVAAPNYRRHVSNYLVDKRLQLQYVILITALSLLIAGTLGVLIYQQEHRASEDLLAGLQELANDPTLHGFDAEMLQDYQRTATADIEARDRRLVLQMLAIGVGLTVILSGYLVIMTHKVAGPLHKVATYLDHMADGRWYETTPLRHGDMLQDFYAAFRDMHEAVRARRRIDADAMVAFVRAAADAPGELTAPAAAELEQLARHATAHQTSLG